MVLIGEVEPAVSDPRDELADADVITSGGEDFAAFAASRWPELVRLARIIRSRRARIIAVAVLATVSAGRTGALAARGEGTAAALTGGYHLAFWIAAGLVAAAIAVAGIMLRPGD